MTPDSAFDQAMAFGWQAESPYVIALAALCALALLRFGGDNRRALYHTLLLFLAGSAGQFGAGLLHAGGFETGASFIYELSLLVAGVALIRLLGMLFFRLLLPLVRVPTPRIVEDLVTILFYVAWSLVRLRASGLDPSSLLASTAVVTAVLAFAMQDTLGNILGGLALQLDNSIAVGDWVKVDDIVGRVTDVHWRSTSIETRNWETVVVPNSQLMKNRFTVLGRCDNRAMQWRRHVLFNVGLSAPPTRVIPAIEKAIREAEIANVAAHPQPSCVLMDYAHGYGHYDLRYFLTDLMVDDPTDSQVRVHIYAALQRAGLRLAVEEHSLHLTEQSEEHQRAVHEREIAHRLQSLQCVDLFFALTPEELRTVAERLTYSPFAQGEVITRQGNIAHWLYILTAGEADITVGDNGQRQHINTLQAGAFFGEAGMLTGAPRSATVLAKTNVECYRLDKGALEDILKARPKLAEEISQVMASRLSALAQAIAEHSKTERLTARGPHELLERMRAFFHLDEAEK
ncbi:MAG TPA: mechanosensitive ion channel family protein [Burkholderiales bacterium]|nr:mechanosensitive ion channel family protein [Burkholderiales bacterium]